eukprot:6372374-Ditylum_brightwellii.AAC.1
MEGYASRLNELCARTDEFKSESFGAKLIVKGVFVKDDVEEFDTSSLCDHNVFDYVSPMYRGHLLRLFGYNVEEKFKQSKNVALEATVFDELMKYLNKSARLHGGFE